MVIIPVIILQHIYQGGPRSERKIPSWNPSIWTVFFRSRALCTGVFSLGPRNNPIISFRFLFLRPWATPPFSRISFVPALSHSVISGSFRCTGMTISFEEIYVFSFSRFGFWLWSLFWIVDSCLLSFVIFVVLFGWMWILFSFSSLFVCLSSLLQVIFYYLLLNNYLFEDKY